MIREEESAIFEHYYHKAAVALSKMVYPDFRNNTPELVQAAFFAIGWYGSMLKEDNLWLNNLRAKVEKLSLLQVTIEYDTWNNAPSPPVKGPGQYLRLVNQSRKTVIHFMIGPYRDPFCPLPPKNRHVFEPLLIES